MTLLGDLKALAFPTGSQLVHVAQDEYGRILVIDDGKQRILNFDSLFEQSCMQLSHPSQLVHHYTRFMALAVAFVEPAHISLLGLGGGSLLRALHHALPKSFFHVVELRQEVEKVAREYFSLPVDQRVRITINDAFEEIAGTGSASSDIIFSDLYNAYCMAPGQIQEGFFRECARVLTSRGMLVINLHDLPRDSSGFLAMLEEFFPTVLVSATTENTILYAGKFGPERITPDIERLGSIEVKLQQRLSPLLARLQPLQARIAL